MVFWINNQNYNPLHYSAQQLFYFQKQTIMYRIRKVSSKDKERRFLGVCAGISKYINPDMDPVVIRLLWLIITFFALPFMVILYFALAIVLKPEDYEIKEEYKNEEKEPESKE